MATLPEVLINRPISNRQVLHFVSELRGSRSALAKPAKKERLSPHQHAASRADRTSGEPQDDKSVAKALREAASPA